MSRSFEGKVIIITGAGSGIGRATAIKLSHQGATLALADINADSLKTTLSLCSPDSDYLEAFDVADVSSCNKFVHAVMGKYMKINHIFNCAGRNPTSTPTVDVTDEYWDSIMNINIKGTFNITRACIPHLQSGSSFVNVSSVCGLQPTSGFAAYCASKYAVIGFSKCIALELGPKGIRCNVVAPGYIETPTNVMVLAGKEAMEQQTKSVAMGRFGTAEEVADVVVFLFSEEARYMNGSVVEVNGGLK